jgi:uncharacterized protein (TIGR02600 family)
MELKNSGKRTLVESSENPIENLMTVGIRVRRPGVMPIAAPHRARAEGAALIIVLTCLVLVAALAIALLNRVEADRSSSAAYKGGANSRNLSEYAVNVVMAQIASATTGANAGNAWASQPGAIRVYSASGTSLVNIYKLYSSTSMVVNAFPTGDTNMTGWSSSPALYTDLNAPLTSWRGTNLVTNYPILDPTATNSVQGFAISGAPNATTNQPAPMPVNWLYVLQDGTLVAPTAGTSNTVTVTGATAANPITGRIAFWTDDETCKVNINTAAGAPWNYTNQTITSPQPLAGVTPTIPLPANYWDTPVVAFDQDRYMSFSRPWQGEYQRFPGHPATVSLSAVFTNMTTNDLMAIAPRISYTSNGAAAGSQWGTTITATAGSTIPSDGARLYANVDELLYATNRSATGTNPLTATNINQARFFLTTSSRAPDVTLFNTPRLLCWPVNTNSSKQTPYDKLIAFDGTVGANTNIPSTNSYYFTRGNAASTNNDYNLTRNGQLLTYLRNMTTKPVPGFGGSGSPPNVGILGKYNTLMTTPNESEQILTEIFDYIRCINLQDNSVPGSGTTNWYSTNGLVAPSLGINNTWGYGRIPSISKVGLLFWYSSPTTTNTYSWSTNNGASKLSTNDAIGNSMCARVVVESFVPAHGYPEISSLSGYSYEVRSLTSSLPTGLVWGASTNVMTNMFSIDNVTYTNCLMTNISNSLVPQLGGVIPINMYQDGASNSTWINSISYTFGGGTLTTNGAPVPGSSNTPVTANNGVYQFKIGSTNYTYPTNASTVYYGGSNMTVTSSNSTNFYFSGGQIGVLTCYPNPSSYLMHTIFIYLKPNSGSNTNLPWPTITTTNPNYNGPNAWATIRATKTAGIPPYVNALTGGGPEPFLSNDVILCAQVASGDYRMVPTVMPGTYISGGNSWMNHPNYGKATNAHSFLRMGNNNNAQSALVQGASVLAAGYYSNNASTTLTNTAYLASPGASLAWFNGDLITNTIPSIGGRNLNAYGDFDNGYGGYADGPYIGFNDEGVQPASVTATTMPMYFSNQKTNFTALPGFFSPNRLVPSAGVMGSLPTGAPLATNAAGPGSPFQTLLFRPAALTDSTHPGLSSPPDYLLLDLFNMPIVQPYAISEPLSTAGRINMNYQILPFTWIKRSTAVQAALHTEWITAIPTSAGANRKSMGGANVATQSRYPLNLNTNTGTLAGFEQRFSTNGIFVSASEICSIPLIPTNTTYANIATWWTGYTYTGENSKERPYGRIYPKLTTKSNVYTVHYTVQTLKKLPSGTQTQWDESKDKVVATYRGSTTIERYVNPRDPSIPDYTGVSLPLSTGNALPYKFRIISQRQFSP